MRTIFTLLLVFANILAATAQPRNRFESNPDPNFYVFLCLGQSNMAGAAKPEEQDYQWDNPRFQMMAACNFPAHTGNYRGEGRKLYEWSMALPPQCRPTEGLNPADYFGRTLVETLPDSVRVGVITVAVGGCCIEHLYKDYNPQNLSAPGVASWFKNLMAYYDDMPYLRLLACAMRAKHQGVIKGILLHQGCSNNGDREWPKKVNKVYQDLLRDLDLRAEDVPLLAGEVVGAGANGQCAAMNEIIQTLPQTIPTAHVVSSEGLVSKGDNLHFNAEGYRELGRRYAAQWLKWHKSRQSVR